MPRSRLQSLRSSASTTSNAAAPSTRATRPLPAPEGVDDRSDDLCEVQVVDRRKVDLARAALPQFSVLSGLTELLRALGDPTRLQIVCALAAPGVDELCVCDLATLIGVSDSAVSHSLRTLRQLGVVRYRKVGKIAYYTIDDPHVAELVKEGVQHLERDEVADR